jgi:hypothetical protein
VPVEPIHTKILSHLINQEIPDFHVRDFDDFSFSEVIEIRSVFDYEWVFGEHVRR